jgi:hypothetical protein
MNAIGNSTIPPSKRFLAGSFIGAGIYLSLVMSFKIFHFLYSCLHL